MSIYTYYRHSARLHGLQIIFGPGNGTPMATNVVLVLVVVVRFSKY